jgi:hypothetical protein
MELKVNILSSRGLGLCMAILVVITSLARVGAEPNSWQDPSGFLPPGGSYSVTLPLRHAGVYLYDFGIASTGLINLTFAFKSKKAFFQKSHKLVLIFCYLPIESNSSQATPILHIRNVSQWEYTQTSEVPTIEFGCKEERQMILIIALTCFD